MPLGLGCYGEVVAKLSGILSSIAGGFLSSLLRVQRKKPGERAAPTRARDTATVEISAQAVGALRISYHPEVDGAPDPGEIVWTWVPYEENDGRGKDRPVLVVGRLDPVRVIAFALTSKPHNDERDYLSLGVGEWDHDRRPSWVDLGRVLRVDEEGMRREGAVLDRKRFGLVAGALARRYGWDAGGGPAS